MKKKKNLAVAMDAVEEPVPKHLCHEVLLLVPRDGGSRRNEVQNSKICFRSEGVVGERKRKRNETDLKNIRVTTLTIPGITTLEFIFIYKTPMYSVACGISTMQEALLSHL